MAYWRMQLHPNQRDQAIDYYVESLAAGYIGLDFDEDVGDLTFIQKNDLPELQRNYWDFANKMKRRDIVLIMAHHFPYALVRVKSTYNYMRRTEQRLGLWFRHFREVEVLGYYADYIKNAHKWERIEMTGTIGRLVKSDTNSYMLIEAWIEFLSD